ncbi:hypothetical protein DAPPUDRAFT_305121 [Daphnia pulex]|uniref:Uncharacterized protein n=1 Tax=Daphnia pulex TaxID=6669 RepID=E9HVC8_DAPPU|nr:hypothetical protein DAPPUDRAFT_305121 [Daphnia pulex]|eukprot:EFX64306.1 hypothetical protein DAPPUDRAFT_305121 [Daphnia pulex]
MTSHLNRGCFQSFFPKLFRLRHSWTLYLVISAGVVVLFRLYSGHQQLIESIKDAVMVNHTEPVTFTTTTATTTTTSTTSPTTTSTESTFKSTCSLAADGRGPHQNVIGYSIYGGNFSEPKFYRKYLKPFTDTLRTIPIRYPGWVVRIYHKLRSDDVDSWKILNNILDLGSNSSRDHIDLCNATEIIRNRQLGDLFEMTWRWLPLLDDMVDTLLSRDSDSPVFPREEDAVREWLASNQTFHIMRDHPAHCHFFVGCCWGVKINQSRPAIVEAAEKMFHENHLHQYDYDQQLLTKYYKSMAAENMIAHDSYCCQVVKFPSQPYPTPRQNGLFVGWREVGQPMEALRGHCPEKCRPQNLTGTLATADWSFC